MTRLEVLKRYNEITAKHGNPTNGNVYCQEQLISEIVRVLSAYNKCFIHYEYGKWNISPNVCICSQYGEDKENVGVVVGSEWFTKEQLKALHELAFGYQF